VVVGGACTGSVEFTVISLSSTETERWSKVISLELLIADWSSSGRLYTVSVCCVDGSKSIEKIVDSGAVESSVTDGSLAFAVCNVHSSSPSQSRQ
jgi:hypothetical protein